MRYWDDESSYRGAHGLLAATRGITVVLQAQAFVDEPSMFDNVAVLEQLTEGVAGARHCRYSVIVVIYTFNPHRLGRCATEPSDAL